MSTTIQPIVIPPSQLTPKERTAVLKVLEGLAVRFSDPAHWIKGAMAKDADGKYCSASSKNAVCWCLLGGVYAGTGRKLSLQQDAFVALTRAVVKVTRGKGFDIATYNDARSRTRVQILKLVDVAIEMVKA